MPHHTVVVAESQLHTFSEGDMMTSHLMNYSTCGGICVKLALKANSAVNLFI